MSKVNITKTNVIKTGQKLVINKNCLDRKNLVLRPDKMKINYFSNFLSIVAVNKEVMAIL